MITAEQIDATAEWLNAFDEDEQENLIDQFSEEQPHVLGYIMSEEAAELGEEEAELLLFMATMLWQVAKRHSKTPMGIVEAQDLDDLQDTNWAFFDDREQQKGQDFVDFVEPIVEQYEQPELLTYITDMFTEDEDDEFAIEPAAKLPMFVMLKTVVDALFGK